MSSRALLLACVALLGAARPGYGQLPADVARRLEAQHQALRVAQDRMRAWDDSVAREREALDTVYVHPFHVLVQPSLVPLVTRAAQLARDDLAWAGHVIERVATRQFVVRMDNTVYGAKRRQGALATVLDSMGVERTPIAGVADDTATVAQWLRQLAERLLVQDLDTSVASWMGTQPRFDTASAHTWTSIRLNLVSIPSSSMRRCYDGDMGACGAILGLARTSDPVREWFDATGRRALVERQWARLGRTPSGTDARCVEGSDDACVEVLHGVGYQPELIVRSERAALLQLAMQIGGRGAMERLFQPARDPADRIAHVANAPVDSVVRVWRARVRDTRLPNDDLTPAIGAMSLAWIAVFGALSLRSSRWR